MLLSSGVGVRALFQFHTGSIKSVDLLHRVFVGAAVFQFHTGSIKSSDFDEGYREFAQFQFHTGSIKSCGAIADSTQTGKVSIPYWFD